MITEEMLLRFKPLVEPVMHSLDVSFTFVLNMVKGHTWLECKDCGKQYTYRKGASLFYCKKCNKNHE